MITHIPVILLLHIKVTSFLEIIIVVYGQGKFLRSPGIVRELFCRDLSCVYSTLIHNHHTSNRPTAKYNPPSPLPRYSRFPYEIKPWSPLLVRSRHIDYLRTVIVKHLKDKSQAWGRAISQSYPDSPIIAHYIAQCTPNINPLLGSESVFIMGLYKEVVVKLW
jgi:hypothetical protein